MDKLSASILGDPKTIIRFDASDLMPGEVGAGTFWSEMVNWFASNKSTDQVLADIEDVVWQTNTMTQVLEQIAPYEQMAARLSV